MKKIAALFLVMCFALMCAACGPSFKNIKDVDSYLESQRNAAEEKAKFNAHDTTFTRAVDSLLTISMMPLGAMTATSSLDRTMVALYALPTVAETGKLVSPRGMIKGFIDFKRREEVRRRDPGEPEWDMLAEGFKFVGPMTSCIVTSVKPKYWHSSEYKGDDGEVKIATGFLVEMYFGGRKDAQPPCTKMEAQDYLKKVLGSIAAGLDDYAPAVKAKIEAQAKASVEAKVEAEEYEEK